MCGPDPLDAAERFLAGHGRLLDRLRFEVRFRGADPGPLLAALEGYRNADGGYGHGLEPDLRSVTSQPGGALHAFEVFEDAASPRAVQLCDWCASVSLPGGGMPFALGVPDPVACAPFWVAADPCAPSVIITAVVAAAAHRAARLNAAVAIHPWLEEATTFCRGSLGEGMHALALAHSAQLFDAAGDADGIDRLREFVPADGIVHVEGGEPDEVMRPVDFAPSFFEPAVYAADLERLAADQQPDGGWPVDFGSYSPAAELEWRGYMTVKALIRCRAGRARPSGARRR